jgi:hypothetical protein
MKRYILLLAAVVSVTLSAQSYPPAFPRTNATKLFETDRIVVWDIVWPKGQPTAMHRHVYDQVGTYYATGGRVITTPDGASRSATTPVGALSTTRKGTTHIEEGATDPPLRAVFIELKYETGSGQPESPSDVPPAFPRGGAKPLLDDERVTIWDHTWQSGATGVTSRYPRDTIVVWLGKGKLRFTPQSGAPTVVDVAPGQIRRYARGTIEKDELLDGAPRAMVISFR